MRKLSAHPARSIRTLAMGALVSIVPVIVWGGPAHGQSLLQSIFGLGSSPQVHVPQRQRPIAQPARVGIPGSPARVPHAADSAPAGQPAIGNYTTVCVRLCDGFYFPLSHRATRDRFHRDADVCRSRCGQSDARLFYYSNAGGSMDSAVDVNGRSYTRLQNAFLHRKKLVSGCSCKPEPWSAASLRLHQSYAQNETQSLMQTGKSLGSVAMLTGQHSQSGSVDAATAAKAEPPAVDRLQPEQHGIASSEGPAPALLSRASAAPAGPSAHGVSEHRRSRATETVARGPARQPARAQSAPVRLQAAAPRTPVRVAAATNGGLPFLGGSGGAKMRWPGDAQ